MLFGTHVSTYQLVSVIVSVFLPILVALVTKRTERPRVRAILLLVLNAISAALNSWLIAPAGFDWSQAIFNTIVQFVIGVAMLYGLWKPTGVSDAAKRSLR
jgi:peptidoglycan/LPS O-acetylase OafA/YrhL